MQKEGRPVASFREVVAENFFEQQQAAFENAVARVGQCDPVHYQISETGFSLHGAGSLVEKGWFRAIEHLRVDVPMNGSWKVFVWDDAEADWTWNLPPEEYCWGMRASYLPDLSTEAIRVFQQEWLGLSSALHREKRVAYYVPESIDTMPSCERAAPMRTLLNFFLNEEGFQMAHAAAIVNQEGKSFLLPGSGNSGKSTTAVRWLLSGGLFQGDDLCAVGGRDAKEILTVYQTAKLRSEAMVNFTGLEGLAEELDELGEKKFLLHLLDEKSDQLPLRSTLEGILLPEITGEDKSRIMRASPLEVTRALIPQTTLQVPKSDNRCGEILLGVMARTPAKKLKLGTCSEEIVATLTSQFANAAN